MTLHLSKGSDEFYFPMLQGQAATTLTFCFYNERDADADAMTTKVEEILKENGSGR